MSHSKFQIYKSILIIAIFLSAVALCFLLFAQFPKKKLAGEGGLENSQANNIGGNFNLIDFNNKPFSSDMLKGKFSIIYFGFSFCPDVCPESLSKFVQIKNSLARYLIDVNIVFISVDPMRDSATVLKEYLACFHKDFIGLRGSEKEIAEVAKKFKVYYAVDSSNPDSENYMIDHSSFSYVLDKKAKYIKHFYLKSSAEEIMDFILLESKK